jgi:deoxycytidylate deaminase
MSRPSWDEYFMEITNIVKKRSNCIKRKVGCIIVDERDKIILSTGYNGSPRNTNLYEKVRKRLRKSKRLTGMVW